MSIFKCRNPSIAGKQKKEIIILTSQTHHSSEWHFLCLWTALLLPEAPKSPVPTGAKKSANSESPHLSPSSFKPSLFFYCVIFKAEILKRDDISNFLSDRQRSNKVKKKMATCLNKHYKTQGKSWINIFMLFLFTQSCSTNVSLSFTQRWSPANFLRAWKWALHLKAVN